jgi:hypothetical protein
MNKLIAQFIVVFVLCCAVIFGAWLGGAEPGAWSFTLAAVFSVVIVGAIITHKSSP